MPPPPPPRPSSRTHSITPSANLPPKPVQPLPPAPPPYARSSIPYAPRNRRTPAASVLVPLSSAEWERYQNYPGGIGSQILKSHNRKRKFRERDDPEDDDRPPFKRAGDVGLVVDHYNARPEVGVVQRNESPIIGLKSFNNWVKSVLITQFAHPILSASLNHAYLQTPNQRGRGERMAGMGGGTRVSGKVLDMGCGKGGDLTKWAKARIKEYIGVDIAAVSIEQARDRYNTLRPPKFKAHFYATDCYSLPLSSSLPQHLVQEVFPPHGPEFDVVSMQFCMHYAFESEEKARTMLNNVSRWLKKGGQFVGTIPNAGQLLDKLDKLPPNSRDLSFGNAVYKIRFEERHHRPIFGHRYWFYLKDAVDDVPEYIVHWDHFVKLAAEYSLHPVYMKEFHEVFEDNQEHKEFGPLLEKMKVVDSNGESQMDEDQWEAANIYIAFAMEKL
ncbi:hypothetical protein NLI96_g5781 [Meripilus lineatus]|uniref:mRNA cap guanine-N(7) methyltransferase n=1 Tax=Meripilus lineatus TaxID=2056292 RepID=A0AAD5V2A8_9APHY|nr:hypothetical protein NLI96_g5781 [Physisporinus lineatus]